MGLLTFLVYMTDIQRYLSIEPSKRNYLEGVSIYDNVGDSNVLKGFFKLGESAFSREKLFKSLQDLVVVSKPISTKLEKFEAILSKKEERQKCASDMIDAPDEIKSLIENRKRLHVVRSNLFSQLKLMVSNEAKFSDDERGKISNQILHISIEIENIWKQTNYYDLNKCLQKPIPKLVIEVNSDLEVLRKLNAIRTKISQANAGKRHKEDLSELINQRDYLERLIEEMEVDVTIKE